MATRHIKDCVVTRVLRFYLWTTAYTYYKCSIL